MIRIFLPTKSTAISKYLLVKVENEVMYLHTQSMDKMVEGKNGNITESEEEDLGKGLRKQNTMYIMIQTKAIG